MGTRVVRTQISPNGGFSCTFCSCLNFQFLQTTPGIFKLAELILGSLCETMMVNYGTGQTSLLGMSYVSLLTATSAALSTVTILLVTYIFSQKSFGLIRSSLFEILFNLSAACSYFSAATYLALMVNLYLYPVYLITLGFITYPAMIAAYTIGFALGLIHTIDAYYSYRFFKGYR